jgi:serine-type D-Ala-D-Ala endopeptidase (penicillin-binding protein 7)
MNIKNRKPLKSLPILALTLSCALFSVFTSSNNANAQNNDAYNSYQQYYQRQAGGYDTNNDAQKNQAYQQQYNNQQAISSYNANAAIAAYPTVSIEKTAKSGGKSAAAKMGLDYKDDLGVQSRVALVIDQDSNRVLYEKNTHAVLPMASITKLMSALVTLEANLPLDEVLTITNQDIVKESGGSSKKLHLGSRLTRQETLLVALMSSDNVAASALSTYYPGGRDNFVAAMNRKAKQLGMNDTRYVDSSGISSNNVTSAYDLGRLVYAASQYQLIKQFSTHLNYSANGKSFNTTNRLIKSGNWEITLQKTGTLKSAGKCLVMQAKVMGRTVIMVLLDAVGGSSQRFDDAVRIKNWLEGRLS